MNACLPRSAANYAAAIDSFAVDSNPRFKRRDVTGDGRPETFCNQFVEAVCLLLEAPLPKGLLAREQLAWLQSKEGLEAAWIPVVEEQAREMALMGFPTVVGWFAPIGHSHIAMVRPAKAYVGTRIAQAGALCFSDGPLVRGFGRGKDLVFFSHN